jgi:L-ascorbate metabolism protein UlaG (beta-lactamase superfamily)
VLPHPEVLPPDLGLSLRFLGHSTVLIELDGVRLLTDPVLRGIGPLHRHGPPAHESAASVDVVLVSHAHHDHLDLASLRRLEGTPLIVVPAGVGRVLRRAGFERIREVRAGDEFGVGDAVRVLAVPALHDGFRPPLGPRAAALGYLVAGSSGVYFAGDTDVFPEMASLRGAVDAALLPVWGWGPYLGPGHLNPRRAAEAAVLVGARISIPIHWGTLFLRGLHRVWPNRLTAPPLDFARSVEQAGVQTEVRILRPGESTLVLPDLSGVRILRPRQAEEAQ